ncbi:MAG TPA: hypothetical protein PKD16_14835 [Saprospiraceae bacterium]|jgi:hypothetical protein|nr:hypothetical protein [Saprospiraceae bacterium]HMT71440.1 hypothetical protein [Saprospiraceae bacterium]
MRKLIFVFCLGVISNLLYSQNKMVIDIEKGTINGADARYLTDDLCIKEYGKPSGSNKMIPNGKNFKYYNLGLSFSFNDGINSKIKSLRIEVNDENQYVKNFLKVGQLIPNFSGTVTITDIKKQFSKNKIEITESPVANTSSTMTIYSNINLNKIMIPYNNITGIVDQFVIYFN